MQRTELVSNQPTPAPLIGQTNQSAVSWGAIIAGAVIGAALTLTLVTGGSSLGFLAVSPWQHDGASGGSIAMGTIVWLLLTQVIAYGIAGYVTGRLRTKWTDVRGDEIYFRDTAHGFIVWALSSVVGFILLSSVAASMVSGTVKAGASLAGASASAVSTAAGPAIKDNDMFSLDYFTDALMRPQNPSQNYNQTQTNKEISTILTQSLMQGEISTEDETYVVNVIAQRADISETEARERLQQISEQAKKALAKLETQAREAADEARKAAALFALWAFVSLLLGAFVASFAATWGGKARDL